MENPDCSTIGIISRWWEAGEGRREEAAAAVGTHYNETARGKEEGEVGGESHGEQY